MPTVRTRVDACPGVVSPHLAADGALARIRLPGGVIGASALRAVADLADDAGDGAVHLTSRGNLQLRGLDPDDSRPVRWLDAAGLLPSRTHERVRNVLASPLSGIEGGVADVRGLAAALDRGLCARPDLAPLPGRFLFAFDDGRGDVAGERPDVCWLARSPHDGELLVAGTSTGVHCSPADAPDLLLDAAAEFLHLRAEEARQTDTGGSGTAGSGTAGSGTAGSGTAGSDGAVRGTGAGGDGDAAGDRSAARAWRAAELPDAAARIRAALLGRWFGPGLAPDGRPNVTPGPPVANPAVGSAAPERRNVTADSRETVERHVPPPAAGEPSRSARVRRGEGDTVQIDSRPADPGGRSALSGPAGSGNVLIDPATGGGPGRSAPSGPSEGGNVLIGRRGNAVGVAPVLGELSTAQVRLLADLAPEVVVTPWRSVVLPDPHDPDDAERALREAGLVVDPGHAATRVSACAGMPGCAKSLADVRAHARSLIARGTGRVTHVSGCARRCGAPHTAHADVVATGPDTYEEGSR